MPSMETSSTSSSVSASSSWASSGSAAGAWFSGVSAVATRSLMAISLAAQTWTMNAAALFPSRGDEYISHVNVTLCHKQGSSRRQTVLTGTASTSRPAEAGGGRRGRAPRTSRRELELIALRLFTEQGFDNTTIEQIAAEAGVSKRTFFRYFGSKTSVLWSEFDREVGVIRAALAGVPDEVPMMDAIRRAVVAANHYGPPDVPELRMRMNLIGNVPALQSSAAVHYDAWERAISEFAATRTGQPADSLYPLAVGRATLAACRAAYDRWSARADADLTFYLDAALAPLAAGFDPDTIRASAQALGHDITHRVST